MVIIYDLCAPTCEKGGELCFFDAAKTAASMDNCTIARGNTDMFDHAENADL